MKKHLAILAAMAFFASSSMVAQAAISVTGLHNTGEGGVEANYKLTALPDVVGPTTAPTPVVYTDLTGNTYPGAWVPNQSDANWIGPVKFEDMIKQPNVGFDNWKGTYEYTLEFTISGDVADLAGLVISGKWATDNDGTIYLNGGATSFSLVDGYNPLSDFSLTNASGNGFLIGPNKLTFRVFNDFLPPGQNGHVNPTGLLVSGIHATPEPSTLLIWGALVSLGCVVAWKKRAV